jgi:hypothetical protein
LLTTYKYNTFHKLSSYNTSPQKNKYITILWDPSKPSFLQLLIGRRLLHRITNHKTWDHWLQGCKISQDKWIIQISFPPKCGSLSHASTVIELTVPFFSFNELWCLEKVFGNRKRNNKYNELIINEFNLPLQGKKSFSLFFTFQKSAPLVLAM